MSKADSGQNEDVPSIIPHLLANDFGPCFDDILQKIVVANRDTIHQTIDHIIAVHQRKVGKGHVGGLKASGGGRKASAPQYTLKDPKVTPNTAGLKQETHTISVSRSAIEPLAERRDIATKFSKLYEDAVTECRTAVAAIIKNCKEKNIKFFDHSFYFDKRTVMYPDGSPTDCTVGEPKAAKRLQELYPSSKLFGDGASADDIMQGAVGDCFLIGAISATAANDRGSIERLFVAHDTTIGVFGVVFYKDGAWEWVIVDDFVAIKDGRSGNAYPLYACPSKPYEVWPCVLEKAYAKLHYNWDMIDGGWAREAIVDMTGGADYCIDLYRDSKNMTFKQFSELVQDPLSILGCAVGDHVPDSDETGNAGETGAVFGLFKGHQYGILNTKQCRDGTGFVQLRNPWGQCEWTGPYSDGSKEWKQNPDHVRDINPTFGDDGDFWMKWEDFKQYMTQVDVVMTFPPDAEVLTMYGKGSEQPTAETTFLFQLFDANTALPMSIIASQDDPKTKYNSATHQQQKSTPYSVLSARAVKLRRMPNTADDVANCIDVKIAEKSVRERNVFLQTQLTSGLYAITVTTQQSLGSTEKVGFYLRIVGPSGADYALWRMSAPDRRLSIGDCPTLKDLTAESSIAGKIVVTSTAAVTSTQAKPLTQQSMVQVAPATVVVAPSAAVAPQVAPSTTDKEKEELKRLLDEERNYVKHITNQYDIQKSQLELANKKFSVAQTQIGQLEKQIQLMQSQQAAAKPPAFRDPAVTPSVDPWDIVGYSKQEWQSLVEGTFEIASRGKRNTPISSSDAIVGMRTLVTAGLGIDDLVQDHAVVQRRGGQVSLADFSQLANDVIRLWGFRRTVGREQAPNMQSEEL